MDIIQMSNRAVYYYDSLKKKNLPAGWEKYVVTDGLHCLFVKSDYIPKKNEALFYLQTRNFKTLCQLYKRGDDLPDSDVADETEQGPRFTIEPLEDNLMWKVVDHEHNISMTFYEGLVNETQKVETPKNLSQDDILNVPKWMREMGDWIGLNHADEALCKVEVRQYVIAELNKEEYWITLAAALNGHITTDTGNGAPIPQNKLLYAKIEDYLNDYGTPWLDKGESSILLAILDKLDEDAANEVCRIIRAYWESDRNPSEWARDLLWWSAWIPNSAKKEDDK